MNVTSVLRIKKCQYSAFLSAIFPTTQENNYLWQGVMKEREHVEGRQPMGGMLLGAGRKAAVRDGQLRRQNSKKGTRPEG